MLLASEDYNDIYLDQYECVLSALPQVVSYPHPVPSFTSTKKKNCAKIVQQEMCPNKQKTANLNPVMCLTQITSDRFCLPLLQPSFCVVLECQTNNQDRNQNHNVSIGNNTGDGPLPKNDMTVCRKRREASISDISIQVSMGTEEICTSIT